MIGHLDADCFYVSAERVRYPFLQRQPVGVLSNQGACVIAKSYELKARNVTTGMPIWDALPLCPDAIFIKRDFEWYEVLSRQMLAVLQTVSPIVEYYSIDEMFFDAGGVDPHVLQQRILTDIGVPVTIGISKTRSLAKLASDNAKPFGCWTAAANELVKPLHDRMPVILSPNDYGAWLDPQTTEPAKLAYLLAACPNDELTATPVNPVVNNARHEGADCIEPASI